LAIAGSISESQYEFPQRTKFLDLHRAAA